MSIYERIRQVRLANPGWSQHAIAREVGCYESRVIEEMRRMKQGLPPGPQPRQRLKRKGEEVWTDERVQLLSELWMNGYSASQIADRIGGGLFSRCAIIGKAHRLGLAGRAVPQRKTVVRSQRRNPKGHDQRIWNRFRKPPISERERADRAMRAAAVAERQAVQSAPDLFIPPSERKTLLELADRGECKWPYGSGTKDDPFYFCGKRQESGLPYCQFHAARAFSAAQPQERINSRPHKVMETA